MIVNRLGGCPASLAPARHFPISILPAVSIERSAVMVQPGSTDFRRKFSVHDWIAPLSAQTTWEDQLCGENLSTVSYDAALMTIATGSSQSV